MDDAGNINEEFNEDIIRNQEGSQGNSQETVPEGNQEGIESMGQFQGENQEGIQESIPESGQEIVPGDVQEDGEKENQGDTQEKQQDNEVEAKDILKKIPFESIKHYGITPLSFEGGELVIGMLNPDDLNAVDALNFLASGLGVKYTIKKITEDEFNSAIQKKSAENTSYNFESALQEVDFDEFSTEVSDTIDSIDSGDSSSSSAIEEDAPIIRIVSSIVIKAVSLGASDIHIDPSRQDGRVRFRVDGSLRQMYSIPKKIHNAVVTRFKILSNLRLDERRRPMDSRFSSKIQGTRVDFRIATFPTVDGEKVILRVLNQSTSNKNISDIGLSSLAEKNLRDAVEKPHGLILATGPTGSGKTVTIYSLLSLIDKEVKNVVSLEDPVEITVDSIAQSQIFPDIGYTFASGLRSILRGDPDVILVGEIRDKETAELAVQAALTGHLVFSTLHTNTAIGAIARLRDFGLEPFFIAPVLRTVIGQRLLKTFNNDKKTPTPLSPVIREKFKSNLSTIPESFKTEYPQFDTHYLPVPTTNVPSGLRGRTGAFEVLNVTDEMSEAILERATEAEIFNIARREGYTTMEEDSFLKCMQGIVPITEVARISGDQSLAVEGVEI